MTILEQSTIGKINSQTCEDAVVVTDDYIAVIDGSTSKSHIRFHPNMSNGQFCAALISKYIESMPANIDCLHFLQNVTAYIHFFYLRLGADINKLRACPSERMAASAAIYSVSRRELWLVGDCQCLVNGALYDNPKPYEQLIAEMRSAFIRLQLVQGKVEADFREHDTGREFILPVLLDSCQYQNKTFAVIDGFNIPPDKVPVHDVRRAHEIVLATDGYPQLCPTLAESEEALARQLADDPLCIRHFKATKGCKNGQLSFDDRSYIRFLPYE